MKVGLIDLKEEELKLYVAKRDRDKFRTIDTIPVSLNGKSIKHALSSLPEMRLDSIYLSLPLNMLSLRELEFPFSDRKKIGETIAFQIEGLLLGGISEYMIEHLIIHTSEDSCNVLAVCIEKKKLREIIDTFSAAGIEPRVITSLDVCLMNSDRYSGSPSDINNLSYIDNEKRMEMALKELACPTINLRHGEFQYRGDIENLGRTFRLMLILAIILLLVYSTGNLIKHATIKNENKLLSKRIHEIYHNVFPEDKKIIDPLRQFKGRVNEMMKKREVFGSTSPIDILKEIANISDTSGLNGKRVMLNEFKSGDDGILIRGIADTFEDVEKFRNKLSSHYNEVRVLDSALSADSKANFTIMMSEGSTSGGKEEGP